MVGAKVRSGQYADEGAVIRDGLRSLAVRDAAEDAWLRDEVVPTYDAAMGDPGRAVSAGDAWSRLRDHMEIGSVRPAKA